MKFYKRPESYFLIHTGLNFILFFLVYISLFNKIIDKWTIFNFSIIMIILSIILNIIFLSLKNKSLKYYQKIVSRFEDLEDGSDLNQINKYRFPEEDELGKLGSVLNKLLNNLKEFDELKKEKIQLSNKEISFLINLFEKPIVFTDDQGKILHKNKAFNSNFQNDRDNIFENFENSIELINTLMDVFKNKSEDFFHQFSKIEINGKLYNSFQISGFKINTAKYVEYIILFSF